jgi:hypothetical protein
MYIQSKIITQALYFFFLQDSAYHSHTIIEGVAEVSQIFLREIHVLPKLVSYEEHCRRDRW